MVSVKAGVSSEGSVGKNLLPDSLMWLLSGFTSLQAVGLGASVPHWPLAGGHPFATWASP